MNTTAYHNQPEPRGSVQSSSRKSEAELSLISLRCLIRGTRYEYVAPLKRRLRVCFGYGNMATIAAEVIGGVVSLYLQAHEMANVVDKAVNTEY